VLVLFYSSGKMVWGNNKAPTEAHHTQNFKTCFNVLKQVLKRLLNQLSKQQHWRLVHQIDLASSRLVCTAQRTCCWKRTLGIVLLLYTRKLKFYLTLLTFVYCLRFASSLFCFTSTEIKFTEHNLNPEHEAILAWLFLLDIGLSSHQKINYYVNHGHFVNS